MTPKKQLIAITFLFAVFITVIPVIICYSMGYRISGDFKIVETGGIYLSSSEADTSLYVNGKLKKKSGLVDRNILLQNLKPGLYSIKLTKDQFHTWEKRVKIQEKQVEVCYPLLVPEKFEPEEIKKYLPLKQKNKKTKYILNDDYKEISDLFKKPAKSSHGLLSRWYNGEAGKIKTGRNIKLKGNVLLSKEENSIFVRWLGKEDNLPFFINTMKKKKIFTSGSTISSFDFYPGRSDAMLIRFDNGSLYAVEIDTRFEQQNAYRILRYCSRFLVDEQILYYFSGSRLYSIDFD